MQVLDVLQQDFSLVVLTPVVEWSPPALCLLLMVVVIVMHSVKRLVTVVLMYLK